MSDPKTREVEAIPEQLTLEEQRLLARSIIYVERELLDRAYKKIRNWVLVSIGVLTAFGLVSIAGLKTAIVDNTALRLSADQVLRDKVVKETSSKLDQVNGVVEKAKKLSADVDQESARVAAGLKTELTAINEMLDRIRQELEGGTTGDGRDS